MDNGTFIEVPIVDTYLEPFPWEHVDLNHCRRWMGKHWDWSIYASGIYVLLIFSGQAWMKNKTPFRLRRRLFLWNVTLAAFSIVGFLRTFPEILYVLKETGFYRSVCERKDHNSATAFWGWFMTLSKLLELGDTAFVVLRKQPLIFLHWYHHVTVLVYCWVTYEEYDPSLRWFMTMNFFVHGLMYSYYAAKTMQIKLSRHLAMTITTLQLSQMVIGVFINIYSLYMKSTHGNCYDRSYDAMYLALGMYATYFLLFANFFVKAYFIKTKKFLNNNNSTATDIKLLKSN